MASYNRVILMGNLTRDPEIRYIPSGMAVTDIGLAVNDGARTPTANGSTRHVRGRHALGADRRSDERVPQQGLAGVHRGPAEAGHLGRQGRPEAIEAESHLRADANGRRQGPRRTAAAAAVRPARAAADDRPVQYSQSAPPPEARATRRRPRQPPGDDIPF